MDLAMDGYVTVPLLFTVLAVIIASLYLKFRPTDASVKEETRTTDKVDESQANEQKPTVEGKEGGGGEAGAGESPKPEDVSEEKPGKYPQESEKKPKEKMKVEEIGAEETAVSAKSEDPQKKSEKESPPQEEQPPHIPEDQQESSPSSSPEEKLRKEGDIKVENTKTSCPAENNEDLVDDTLKYNPGKIRGSHYEKTLTREELEEEQRRQETPKGLS